MSYGPEIIRCCNSAWLSVELYLGYPTIRRRERLHLPSGRVSHEHLRGCHGRRRAVQRQLRGTAPQLLHVAAPLDLMSAVWNRQHDATRLPPDDLLACVGERDADEDPVRGWGLGGTLVEDHAKLPRLRRVG